MAMNMMCSHKLIPTMISAMGFAAFSMLPVAAQNTRSEMNGVMNDRDSSVQQAPNRNQAPGNTQTVPNQGGNQNQRNQLNASDRQFMIKAAQSDMTEIMTSQIALQRASSNQVKSYAQMMIKHHTTSSSQLKPLAQQKGVTLPTAVGADNKALVDQLSKLSGKAFDQAYMAGQVQAHTKTEAEYRRQLKEGQDADVKAFANQFLPVVVEHRQMAQGMIAGR
jgi:putative membrane protein